MTTLGPGPAAVLWTQGCPHACRGCMTPRTWLAGGGKQAAVADVAGWLASTGLLHLTLSGGEPADQAGQLVALIDQIRAQRDWVVTLYSGYERHKLETDRPHGSAALVERADLLIDGRYVETEHAPLLWRGSRNQRLHALSGRVALPDDDDSAGVAVHIASDGAFEVIGVPPAPGFVAELMATVGSTEIDRQHTFPFPVLEDA